MSRPRSARRSSAPREPWWRGSRGEAWVLGQVVLMALVFLGPRTLPGWPHWVQARLFLPLGCVLMAAGGLLLFAAALRLGPALTPLPYPRPAARFVRTGAYALVRHPIYSGGLILALGWTCCVQGWLTLGYTLLLFLFLDLKSRREETWLLAKYPEYAHYQRQVSKLIPYVY